jgi:outer membrane protein assembly factor BamB
MGARGLSCCGLAAALAACSGSPARTGPGTTLVVDAGAGSVAPTVDAGDPGLPADAGSPDAGTPDAGFPDAGAPDAGTPDAGPADAGTALLTPGGGDWGQYRYDQRGASENPAIFAASEAPGLVTAWTQELGQYIYTQAMITQDTVVFTTAASSKVVAVDAATGATLWQKTFDSAISTTCGGTKHPGFWAAAAVVGEAVYVASPDGNVYALHKSDGSTIWAAKVADPTAAGHGEFIQSSPSVSTALGKLYVGVASSYGCDEVAGRIAAVDLATGAVQQAALVPAGKQGAAVWSSVTIAEDEDRLYVTTGNRIGPASDTPNSQAMLAIDPHTLAVLDRWQNPTALDDCDFGSSATLAESGGVKVVAATSKDGYLYVLRRDALAQGPLWKAQLAVLDPSKPTVGGDATAGWGSLSTPTFARGRLYAAGGRTPLGEPGSVTAFDPATGAVAWHHATPGYVLTPVAVAGDILAVESSAVDGTSSALEVIDVTSGAVLKRLDRPIATFAAPAIGRGLLIWSDAFGHVTALAAQNYRR